jgi:UDP-N-acetylglucosamine--N-acetylmuramyl-(pentapeptide) pyrophosphoryl-undecaprenol N-acetylglucosamine transferase
MSKYYLLFLIMNHIFLAGGRTGGPIIPLLSIANNLPQYTPIIIGIKNSFEEKYAVDHGIKFISLFESKSSYHSFKIHSIGSKLIGLFSLVFSIFLLIINVIKMIICSIRYKPSGILSAGGFTAVPAIYAAIAINFIRLTNIKIITHQQDPDIGLTNKLTARFADYLSCVFDYTRSNPLFDSAKVIYNPIDINKFAVDNSLKINSQINTFFQENTSKPVVLIFGGGSGAQAINHWVWDNINDILKSFSVIHLTGDLQETEPKKISLPGYLSLTSVYIEMPYLLKKVDLVICRAGLSSITELLYLNKPAFLIPIPNSHQENNAKQVQQYFEILDQRDTSSWLTSINTKYPTIFKQKMYPRPEDFQQSMQDYIADIRNILDK